METSQLTVSMRSALSFDVLPAILAFLATLILLGLGFTRPGIDGSKRAATEVFLLRAGLSLLLLAFAVQISLGVLQERRRIAQHIIVSQPREAVIPSQVLTQHDDRRPETDAERIVEKFRASHSETRTYFTHASIAVRVPYPSDWVTSVEQNDEKEFRIRFYPRVSDSSGYALRRVPRTNEELLRGIRNADVTRVMRSGMAMDRVRIPPQRNPFDESSTPLAWWVQYEWHDEAWKYTLDGAEDDPMFEAAAMLLKFPDTIVPTRETGVIEGSLSSPSEIVLPQEVCAVEVSTNRRFCTNEQLYDDMRYANDIGYRLQVPPGTYVVSSTNRGFEARYLGCSVSELEQCASHAVVPVVVSAGVTVSGIDPQEWFPIEGKDER